MKVCTVYCSLSAIFIIAMIYFYYMTNHSNVVAKYKSNLPKNLQVKYNEIVNERFMISINGFVLGLIIAIIIILYNLNYLDKKISSLPMFCIIVGVSFLTNYFFYILYPKSDWMLNHIKDQKTAQLWVKMYRTMQFNYHLGLVFGIIAVGLLGFAFKC